MKEEKPQEREISAVMYTDLDDFKVIKALLESRIKR